MLRDCLGIALEACRSALQPSWSVFGTVLERLGPSWKRLGGSLEASLERLGPSWSVLERLWSRLGASGRRLGASWRRLEASWRCLGDVLEAQKST